MNYSALQTDVLRRIRGKATQKHISSKLGFDFNQVYRWESGRTQIGWQDFVRFCEVCKVKLSPALKECFSYFDDQDDTKALVQHFVGNQKQADIARDIGVSRYSLSRWLRGTHEPNLAHVFQLMRVGSVEFYRFIETLTGTIEFPSIRDELQREQAHLALYDRFPWLSTLLSAIDLAAYKRQPTISFLSKKAKVAPNLVKEAIEALHEQDLLHWNGSHWETRIKRISVRGSLESRKKMARYVLSRAADGIEPGLGTPFMRYSWKQFSLNQKDLNLLLQKFTEFFNELGSAIDAGQKDADKVYLFSACFVDFDHLPEDPSK